ncbi:F-box protein SKP2B [Vitis vinifera]|uniref:F-box protein SKP2B n=1 Tax=Vitis vinifera TaxID=29760 RepID=A0A438CDG3_VITVI|nr:F-box protein SKP2B [Vitis vinifera]
MNNLVLSLAPKFTKLQALTLRQDKPQLEDKAVEIIANYCHDLQDLDLSKSFKLSDSSLYALAHGCPNLTKLNISGWHCSQLQSLNLGWCEDVSDAGVMSLAYGCPDLRALDLCGCVHITDESVIALANRCLHLRSLGLYFCQNITDKAMYSLAQSRVKNKHEMWESMKSRYSEEGLMNLNISQCTALTPPAVQAVCDSFPALHTCPGRHSLIISGCLSLTSVHCACGVQAHRTASQLSHPAH